VFALGYNYNKFIGNRAQIPTAESSRRVDNPSGVGALSDANSMLERKPVAAVTKSLRPSRRSVVGRNVN